MSPYLVEAVESVLAQTVGFAENIQIVLVNDGNSNDTKNICERYRNRYPDNIISIEIPSNASLSSLRNAGLKIATGRYINFLNPGNKWDKETCREALNFFEKNPKVSLACFPIILFGSTKGEHWLNYKFAKTRVVNIFKDQDCSVFDLCSCLFAHEIVKDRLFNEEFPVSEEAIWLAKLLVDEQEFGVIAKTYCRCRFNQSSGMAAQTGHLSYYLDTLRLHHLEFLRYAKEKYGEIPHWVQYEVMLDLTRRIKEQDKGILNPLQKKKYQDLLRACLEQINDQIICSVRNFWAEERLYALALKYDMTYDQIKEWVKADEETKSLCFCRPGFEQLPPMSRPWHLCVEFMDITTDQLVLHGSCPVLVSGERLNLVLEVEYPDGSIEEYLCELFRRPDRKQPRFFEDVWIHESFEQTLPLTDEVKVRAFVNIEGIRFDLEWRHGGQSSFIRGDEYLFWERSGYTVSQLPDNTGLRVESWSGDSKFLFSFIIPAYNVESYLAEAVESVIAQTVGFEENIQIVLVNDGSTDGTGAVCEYYQSLWPDNITYIDKPNGGLSSARNAGIKVATGRYINFLDADDKWDPDACEAALTFFEQHPGCGIAWFPMIFFESHTNPHWLNYKFTSTRVANIFADPYDWVNSACSCFVRNEVAKRLPFNEQITVSEDIVWIGKLLLGEQNFGLVSRPNYRYRKRYKQNSIVDTSGKNLAYYLDTPRLVNLELIRQGRELYVNVPSWIQNAVMLEISWRLKHKEQSLLTPTQKEEYRGLIRSCLVHIDDQIILTARNLWGEERLFALALKYGMSYDQIKEWVKPDSEAKGLCFCRPESAPSPVFTRPWNLRVEFIDIVEGQLLLRASCMVMVPRERMNVVLEVEFPDGRVEYPCELLRRPDRRQRLLIFEDAVWLLESFERTLPLTDGATVRAFVEIDGIRFDMNWVHEKQSPFVKRQHWEHNGHTFSQLPENAGFRVESWGGSRFLFSFVIPAYNVRSYLAEAVESVIAQTVGFEENIQIVLVNDGSTDGTGAVCKRYRDLYPDNIVYIDKPNGGMSSARNEGMRVATGRYINFFDADDKWDSGVCQAVLDFSEKYP